METIHIVFAVFSALAVLYADEQGLMWVLGKKSIMNARRVMFMHWTVTVGLLGLLLTGGLMFIDRASYLLSQPIFIAKMGFVAALVINGFFVGSLSRIAETQSYAELNNRKRVFVQVSAAVSVISWIGAIACGLLLSL